MKKIASSCTKQVHSAYPEGSFQRLFWDQQIQASSHSNPKSMKWHPIFIKWSLYLKYLSGKSYELLRKSKCIKLPSKSTLRDYTHHIPSKTGFSTENDQQFVDAAFLSEKLNKYVLLVMDEMHIKHDLVYDKHSGSLIGFVDLGNAYNQIMEFEKALSAKKTDRSQCWYSWYEVFCVSLTILTYSLPVTMLVEVKCLIGLRLVYWHNQKNNRSLIL